MLIVIDECTRQALAVHVAIKLGSVVVLETLYPLIIEHGKPEHIRVHQGPGMRPPVPETTILKLVQT